MTVQNPTKSQIQKFIQNYPIGELVSFRRLTKGFANKLYHLKTTKGDYILKLAVRNNPYRVRYEMDLLNFIKNLPTPKLIKSRSGHYLKNLSGHKTMIYHYLSGAQKINFSPAMLKQVGEFLGKLHQQTKNFHSPVKRLEFYNISPTKFRSMINTTKSVREQKIGQAIVYVEQNMPKYFLPKSLPQGAMHIDLKPENTLFNGQRLTGVVDFDNSYNGPLLLDLAKALVWFGTSQAKFVAKKAGLILAGYSKHIKLNRQEKNNLAKAIHLAFLNHFLVDAWLYAQKKMNIPKHYVIWEIDNLIKAERNIKIDNLNV